VSVVDVVCGGLSALMLCVVVYLLIVVGFLVVFYALLIYLLMVLMVLMVLMAASSGLLYIGLCLRLLYCHTLVQDPIGMNVANPHSHHPSHPN
jgi:hypothetical protein